jgi:riboflavin kinase / FMN adenylyltransferase
MQHLRSLDISNLHSAWVAIGSFDGVHRGHQALIRQLVTHAHEAGSPAVVITFYPHPMVVIKDFQGAYYLTTPDERARLLSDLGIDAVITLPFTQQLASLTADEFMDQLSASLHLRSLWVGPDFALGRNRTGNIETLREIGQRLHYELRVIQPITDDSNIISSSLIRKLVSSGDVSAASRLLGRYYATSGEIVHGDGRGKGIGIPTANQEVWPELLLPATGVYATWALLGDRRLPSVTNIGFRPTFENQPVLPRIETHLLDFEEDLYTHSLKLEYVERLRPEQRFSSIQALLDQIHVDIGRAREVLLHAS